MIRVLKKMMLFPIAVAVVAVTLAGCTQAVTKTAMEPAPEPEPAPLPTVTGTWRSTTTSIEHGRSMTEVMVLTFIGERFIESRAEYDAAGRVVETGYYQGGWAPGDAMIVKRWYDHGEYRSVTKKYYWGDAQRSVMFVEHWGSEDPEKHFTRLQREPGVLPVEDLFGTWMLTEDEGGVTWTVTISPEGTFSLLRVDLQSGGRFHISGNGMVDLENYFINLTELTSHREGQDDRPWWGGVGRAAFAPGTDGGIRMSWPWHEPPIIDARVERGEEPEPYGSYWMLFKKVPPTTQ